MDRAIGDGTNVVQFPSERAVRLLMKRVCEVEPDVRDVLSVADSLGLDMPAAELRERVDAETARHIAEQVLGLAPAERRVALDALLAPVPVAAALRACRDAAQASRPCAVALRNIEQDCRDVGHWMAVLEGRVERLALEAGLLLVVAAHERCQRGAWGDARGGSGAAGEAWTPCDAAQGA